MPQQTGLACADHQNLGIVHDQRQFINGTMSMTIAMRGLGRSLDSRARYKPLAPMFSAACYWARPRNPTAWRESPSDTFLRTACSAASGSVKFDDFLHLTPAPPLGSHGVCLGAVVSHKFPDRRTPDSPAASTGHPTDKTTASRQS